MIKENRSAESAGTLSKGGRFQTDVLSVEIHVKDAARFPGKWAFFASGDGKKPGEFLPTSASCYSCHPITARSIRPSCSSIPHWSMWRRPRAPGTTTR